MKFLLTAIIVLVLAANSFAGPIFPSRAFVIAPEFRSPNDTIKGAAFMRQQGIWGDVSHGFNSAGDRYYWSISTGGIIQIVEWDLSAIYLIGDYEMVGDQHSNIHFHPRGIFWTEGVMYMNKLGKTELSVGYINRCHHDIDNLEFQPAGNDEERTLIYSSILARAVWRDVNVASVHSTLWAQVDEYVFKQDYLIPIPAIKATTNFEQINASLSAGGKFDLFAVGSTEAYLRTSLTATGFNSFKTTTLDVRAELGLDIFGMGSNMNLFIGAESLQDDGTRPIPVNSKYVYIGFRFIGKNIGI